MSKSKWLLLTHQLPVTPSAFGVLLRVRGSKCGHPPFFGGPDGRGD